MVGDREDLAALVELLTAEDVGRRFRVHPRTILAAARRGDLPAVRLGRRTVRFRPADVERYVAKLVVVGGAS